MKAIVMFGSGFIIGFAWAWHYRPIWMIQRLKKALAEDDDPRNRGDKPRSQESG